MFHGTHFGKLSTDKIASRRHMVRHWFKATARIWQLVGDAKVGLVLLDRYWSGDDPWVTADYVVAALDNHYSDDTVRRRLKALVKDGTVLSRTEGRLTLYAFRPTVAEEVTLTMEEGLSAKSGQNPIDSRNLRPNLIVIGPLMTHDNEVDET
jgi:hypothetical protein